MFFDFFGNAMCAENRHGACRYFVRLLDKLHAFLSQALHDMRVMHDFMTYINRRPEFIERHFDDFDSTFDSGTKTAGLGEDNLHKRSLRMTNPMDETVN